MLEKFQLHFPTIVELMRNTTHHRSDKILNPYHLEGDVWSHTMMVLNNATNGTFNGQLQKLIALLHDTGKCYSREISKQHPDRVHFFGHQGISYHIASWVMDEFGLCQSDKITVLNTISLHHRWMDYLSSEPNQEQKIQIAKAIGDSVSVEMLFEQMRCDSLGRFCKDDRWNKDASLWWSEIRDIAEVANDKDLPERPICHLMVGVPASGKSTHAKSLDLPILSRDEFVEKLGEGNDYSEKFANVDQKKVDVALSERLKSLIGAKESFVVDMTNTSPKSRLRTLSQLPKTFHKHAIVMTTGFEEIFNRNELREGKSLKGEIILNMMKSFTVPTYDEFDTIEYVETSK